MSEITTKIDKIIYEVTNNKHEGQTPLEITSFVKIITVKSAP